MKLAAFIFSIMNVAIHIASETIVALEIAFFRNLFAFLILLPWLAGTGLSALWTKRMGLRIWRADFGLLLLAEAVALSFTTPIFVTVVAALILGEIMRARRWSATAAGL